VYFKKNVLKTRDVGSRVRGMNIFVLSLDPKECAEMHVDKHVVKMILEYCQLLCTAHWVLDPESDHAALYKKTHTNHPCAKWVRESISNYMWLLSLLKCLFVEYEYRYKRVHASKRLLGDLEIPPDNIPIGRKTPFALAMPDEYKVGTAVDSYIEYYRHGKRHLHSWKFREYTL
jgi:hypothetical protein